MMGTTANKFFSSNDAQFDFSKKDEYIYFVNRNVIKYFSETNIVKNRVKRANLIKNLIPNIIKKSPYFYSYKMIDGNVLYDQKDTRIILDLLNWLKKELWNPIELSYQDLQSFFIRCKNFYHKKTLDRLKRYYLRFECSDKEVYYQ